MFGTLARSEAIFRTERAAVDDDAGLRGHTRSVQEEEPCEIRATLVALELSSVAVLVPVCSPSQLSASRSPIHVCLLATSRLGCMDSGRMLAQTMTLTLAQNAFRCVDARLLLC